MRTGVARKWGIGKSIDAYIDLAGRDTYASKNTIKRAHEIQALLKYRMIEGSPSMRACAILWLASKSTCMSIPVAAWKGTASYNTLLDHARELLPVINEKHVFPNLRNLVI